MRVGLIVAGALLMTAADAGAHTWRVELDGSGDFTDIQPAVEASAAGDTILIGPGRFDTFHPCVAPAWTEEAVVWVLQDDLSFIGAGRDRTIVGPTSYYGPYAENPKGFCSFGGYNGRIKDLTIENIENGVYWHSGIVSIDGCTVRGESNPAFIGVALWTQGATLRNCTIDTRFAGDACAIGVGGRDVTFEDCSFVGFGNGVFVTDGSRNTRFIRCQFTHLYHGVVFDQLAQGSMSECSFDGIAAIAITVWNAAHADLDMVHVQGAATGIATFSGGVVTGANVVLAGTWNEGLLACCNAYISIHNSHFLPAMGYAVRCAGEWAHSQLPDLTGCYWGTTDADAIRTVIWDANDTSETNGIVNFEPYANGPVPAEVTSWGDLKASFR